jgi:hypothetical protein
MVRSKNNPAPDQSILKLLKKKPLSVNALAETLGEDRGRIYRACRRLEQRRLLTSELVDGPRLFFCLDHKRVITSENYEDCREDEIVPFFVKQRIWRWA